MVVVVVAVAVVGVECCRVAGDGPPLLSASEHIVLDVQLQRQTQEQAERLLLGDVPRQQG